MPSLNEQLEIQSSRSKNFSASKVGKVKSKHNFLERNLNPKRKVAIVNINIYCLFFFFLKYKRDICRTDAENEDGKRAKIADMPE